MIKPLSRKSFWLLILATPLMVVLVLSGIWVFSHTSTALYSPEPVTVVIRQGEALGSFVGRLAGDGIIRNPLFLKILAKIRRDANRIQAGEYIFQGRITPDEFLDILVEGHARLVQLTIPEGFNLADVAARLEELGLGNGKEFLRLSKNPEFIRQIEVPIQPARPNLEGYIFPETYHLHAGLDEGALLRAMVKQFAQQAAPLLKNVPPHLNMNPYQVLVLASIIEKETGAGHERPLISAVFHNRLKIKMPLQSDPTIIYGVQNFDGNLTLVHKNTRTEYNTYQIGGLPPTPIANPGLESIKAALNPAKVDYLYFVSKGDGTHFFSKDYSTHRKAVKKYQVLPYRRKKS